MASSHVAFTPIPPYDYETSQIQLVEAIKIRYRLHQDFTAFYDAYYDGADVCVELVTTDPIACLNTRENIRMSYPKVKFVPQDFCKGSSTEEQLSVVQQSKYKYCNVCALL